MRLIDAEKLCRLARNLIDHKVGCNDIMRFPQEDAVPIVHAHWITVRRLYGNKSDLTATCSNCDSEFVCASVYDTKDYKYCPNCGARMDEEE